MAVAVPPITTPNISGLPVPVLVTVAAEEKAQTVPFPAILAVPALAVPVEPISKSKFDVGLPVVVKKATLALLFDCKALFWIIAEPLLTLNREVEGEGTG